MAKPTPAPSPARNAAPPAGAIVQTQAVIDQTLANAGPVVDPLESAFAALASADTLALLNKVSDAKPEAFKEVERDFWKPQADGANKSIRGIYMGADRTKRIIQHAFAVRGKDGKPLALRCNGGHVLTNELRKVQPGDGVQVEYLGQTTTGGGNKLGNWKVSKLQG